MSNHPTQPAQHLARIHMLQHLARIHLLPEEMESLGQDLDKVFSWISQLDILCVRGTHSEQDSMMNMRDDIVTDGDQVELVLRNAPHAQGAFFTVPKVLKS